MSDAAVAVAVAAEEYADDFEQVDEKTTTNEDEYAEEYDPLEEDEEATEDEPFVEEEVESVPAEMMNGTSGLSIIGHSALLNPAPIVKQQAPAAAAAIPRKPASSSSSLPSLTGLPSISSMGSGLTAAGRAHFGGASLFGGASKFAAQPPSSLARPIRTTPVATATNNTTNGTAATPDQLKAYADSNVIWSAESLGIHPVVVSADSAATPEYVSIDGGRLKLWAGSVGADLPSVSLTGASASSSASGLAKNLFLRGALCDNAKDAEPDASTFTSSNYLHIFVDSAVGAPPSNSSLVDEDGQADATLSACFHAKQLGHYRLRLIGAASALPEAPDSFERFMVRAQAENGGGSSPAGTGTDSNSSAFDIAPVVTLLVCVEKLVSPLEDDSAPNSFKDHVTEPLILPPLPIGSSHTFWLSSHRPGASACSLVFGTPSASAAGRDATDASTTADEFEDHFELTLDAQPLHEDILAELDVHELDLDDNADDAKTQRTRREKKAAAKNKKKKKKAKSAATAAVAAAAAAPSQSLPLITVELQPVLNSTDLTPLDFVRLSFTAAPFTAATTTVSSDRVNSYASAPPSLVDLLATLAASPPAALPSSIRRADQSLVQVAQLATGIARASEREAAAAAADVAAAGVNGAKLHATARGSAAASAASSSTLASVASASPSSPAAASSSGASAAAVALELSLLERRVSWPFQVELAAMRLGSDGIEGHASFADLDLLHNRAPPRARSVRREGTTTDLADPSRPVLVGDHEVTLLRTVGLLCAWSPPRDASRLTHPVLVSQQPHLSYHVQVRLKRLDSEEAAEREMDALLG